ncbi:MAG TPA: hypothetical protein VGD77_12930 [Gemmatimonadaceae bacterium]
MQAIPSKLLAAMLIASTARAQERPEPPAADSTRPAPAAIFTSESPLAVTLSANLGALRSDRDSNPAWRAAELRYAGDSGERVLAVRARPRGIWRRKNCAFPPLRLDLPRKLTGGTPFEGLDRPKLVNYCRPTATGEQYVLAELQLYRVYALLTPYSHRVRLLRITYADSAGDRGRGRGPSWGFLVEEPKALAARAGMPRFEIQGVVGQELDPYQSALMSMFQYLIGNTDFGISGLHNVELLQRGEVFYPVPYDFDYAGAINAAYAGPDPRLPIRKVTDRMYRGYCVPPEVLERVLALFREKKDAIRALYFDEVGQLLRDDLRRQALRFFDGFYAEIASPARARMSINNQCTR